MNRKQPEQPEAVNAESNQAGNGVKSRLAWVVLAALIILAAIVAGVVVLARTDAAITGQVRDIFIIILAMEALIIGVALVILAVQLALLINLLQNEIKPILENTRRTVLTLKGTSAFLSKHAIQPVMRVSSLAAGLRKLIQIIGIIRK